MATYREPRKMTASRRKIEAYEESRLRDRQAIALLAGEPITAESLAAAYRQIFDSSSVARSREPGCYASAKASEGPWRKPGGREREP